MVKDPICGMFINSNKSLKSEKSKSTFYFCSKNCKDKFEGSEKFYKTDKFSNVFPCLLGLILIAGTVLSIAFDFMILYMGIFFIVFSLFKIFDWKGFVNVFRMYDLLAKGIKPYAWAYPGIEFVLGASFILNYFIGDLYLISFAWTTLFIMGIGAIGVGIKLLKKEKFQCACLGTKINVPLTKVTLLEDLLMTFMALIIVYNG